MNRERTIRQALKFLQSDVSDRKSADILYELLDTYKEDFSFRTTEKRIPMEEWKEDPVFPLPGKEVGELLQGGEELVFFGGTLGIKWERKLMELSLLQPGKAFYLDALLSAVTEEGLNVFQEELAREVAPLYVTDRFSPGYGDLPFSLQRSWGELLDIERTLGVRFTDRDLMIPRKSVLAMCVITGEKPEYRHRGCEECILYDCCRLRLKGSRCSVYGG